MIELNVQGVELAENDYFITQENVEMLNLAKEANAILVRKLSSYHFQIIISLFGVSRCACHCQ